MGQEVEVSTENPEDIDNPDEDFNDEEDYDDDEDDDDDGENAEEGPRMAWAARGDSCAGICRARLFKRDFVRVDLGLDLKRDKILIQSVPFQLALLESVKPTIASTRSRQNIEHPNYAADEDEVEEIGNLYQARILSI